MDLSIWIGVAVAAFLSATILPGSSEVALIAALLVIPNDWLGLWAVATLANGLGSIVNYAMGAGVMRFQDKSWFPVKPKQSEKAQVLFQKYGVWALLLSWVPLFGDALTLVAGAFRVRLALFISLVALAKGARYGALIFGFDVVT